MKQRILVVANRLPVAIQVTERSFHFQPSPGGLASALSALNDSYELMWIGWPGEVDLSMIQPENISAELKKEYNASAIFLTRRQLNRFYFGFSNRVLWPVLHYLPTHIDYDEKDFRVYREVNRVFADRIIEELQQGNTEDIVWVHDYQLMLVPSMVREKIPEARIGFFLHTPFPSSEMFRALPYREELLKGLLGANLIGFQTHSGLRHFRSSLLHILGIDSEINRIDMEDHSVMIGAYPISVDPQKIESTMEDPDFEEDLKIVRQIKKGRKMILSVDRLDYTKGIPERLSAYKKFLERNPEKAAEVVLVQVAVPSRTKIPDYRHLKDQVEVIVMDIIEAHETLPDSPIQFMYRSLPFRRLAAFYREADVALVTPYFDGMNLVAKEYVAVKKDHGALILSELAGAASELGEAIIINPWNRDQISDALESALELSQDECTRRMTAMYERVKRNNVHYWSNSFLEDMIRSTQEYADRHGPVMPLNVQKRNELKEQFQESSKRLLLLDYDGTLAEIQNLPLAAAPDQELREIMERITKLPDTDIAIVTGRKRQEIEDWMGKYPVIISAEHGLWVRMVGEDWQKQLSESHDLDWLGTVEDIFEQFNLKTPGSFTEKKEAALAWHYRLSDPTFGKWQARELVMHLKNMLSGAPLDVLDGKSVIEVRVQGIHKGNIIPFLETQNRSYDFHLAAGDDATDEHLFQAIPGDGWSIKIGAGYTHAHYRLNGVRDFRGLLKFIAED